MKREAGVIPARTRHCKDGYDERIRRSIKSLAKAGKAALLNIEVRRPA